jgi:hypothetical protein
VSAQAAFEGGEPQAITKKLLAQKEIARYEPFNLGSIFFSHQYVETHFDRLVQEPVYHPLITVDEEV